MLGSRWSEIGQKRTLHVLFIECIFEHLDDYDQLFFNTPVSKIQNIRKTLHFRNQYILKLDGRQQFTVMIALGKT